MNIACMFKIAEFSHRKDPNECNDTELKILPRLLRMVEYVCKYFIQITISHGLPHHVEPLTQTLLIEYNYFKRNCEQNS